MSESSVTYLTKRAFAQLQQAGESIFQIYPDREYINRSNSNSAYLFLVEQTDNPGLVEETLEGNKHSFEQVHIVHQSVEQTDNPGLVEETVEQIR